MKKIEVTDEVYDALKKLTTDFNQQPTDVLARLLNLGSVDSDAPSDDVAEKRGREVEP